MERKGRKDYEAWGVRMVSGVECFCKVRVFVAPDLPALETSNSSDYEYDFLYERQVVADHEEFLKSKKHLDQAIPTSIGEVPSVQLNVPPEDNIQKVVELSSRPHVSDSQSFSSCDLRPLSLSSAPPPPAAASHLVSGQILLPSILDGNPSQPPPPRISEQVEPQDSQHTGPSSEFNCAPRASASPSACTYLKDFDNGADDPFAMTELKTINELEELKKILCDSFTGSGVPSSSSSVADMLATKATASACNEKPHPTNDLDAQSSVNSDNLSYSSFFSSDKTLTIDKSPETIFVQPKSYSQSHLRSIHSNTELNSGKYLHDEAILNVTPNNLLLESTKLSHKKTEISTAGLNSSFSQNVKLNSLPQRPQSCSGGGRISGQRSLFNTTKHQNTISFGGSTDISSHNVKLEENLLSWATSSGFSHSHARRLLELGMKKRVFTYKNLEQNKLILLNLLHTFNSLLTNFSSSGQSSHRLSEESALVITLTFPNDLSKIGYRPLT
ncbi:unnamed protein product [Trichobilharzia szidati]|nr:unnamed protein product [Trichobilharzia szidati]